MALTRKNRWKNVATGCLGKNPEARSDQGPKDSGQTCSVVSRTHMFPVCLNPNSTRAQLRESITRLEDSKPSSSHQHFSHLRRIQYFPIIGLQISLALLEIGSLFKCIVTLITAFLPSSNNDQFPKGKCWVIPPVTELRGHMQPMGSEASHQRGPRGHVQVQTTGAGDEVKLLSRVRLFMTPWTVAYNAPLSRQDYRSGLPFPSPRSDGDEQHLTLEPESRPYARTRGWGGMDWGMH